MAIERVWAVWGVLVAAVAGLTACGAAGRDEVVVRVGDMRIDTDMVDRWTRLMRPDAALAGSSGRREKRGATDQALSMLIAAEWLIGEGADRGIALSGPANARRIEAGERRGFPGGAAEFRAYLKTTGQTSADVLLRSEAELASAGLRRRAAQQAPPVTAADVARYYRAHRRDFAFPEMREVRITNRKSAQKAIAVLRELESGQAARTLLAREGYAPPAGADPRHPLPARIYEARPRVPTGPVRQGPDYFVFVVTRIVPGGHRTLAQVESSVRRRLLGERRRQALASFARAMEAKWTARTSCRRGYVVQKCRQYAGPRTPEDPLSLG